MSTLTLATVNGIVESLQDLEQLIANYGQVGNYLVVEEIRNCIAKVRGHLGSEPMTLTTSRSWVRGLFANFEMEQLLATLLWLEEYVDGECWKLSQGKSKEDFEADVSAVRVCVEVALRLRRELEEPQRVSEKLEDIIRKEQRRHIDESQEKQRRKEAEARYDDWERSVSTAGWWSILRATSRHVELDRDWYQTKKRDCQTFLQLWDFVDRQVLTTRLEAAIKVGIECYEIEGTSCAKERICCYMLVWNLILASATNSDVEKCLTAIVETNDRFGLEFAETGRSKDVGGRSSNSLGLVGLFRDRHPDCPWRSSSPFEFSDTAIRSIVGPQIPRHPSDFDPLEADGVRRTKKRIASEQSLQPPTDQNSQSIGQKTEIEPDWILVLQSRDIKERYNLTAAQIRNWSKDPQKGFISRAGKARKYRLNTRDPELRSLEKKSQKVTSSNNK